MKKRQALTWLAAILTFTSKCRASATAPEPMSAQPIRYDVAMATTQLIDYTRDAPFAPSPGIPRVMEVSIFFPTTNNTTTMNTTYFPRLTAEEVSSEYTSAGLNATADGLEQLTIPLATPGTSIAKHPSHSAWRTLIFSPAFNTTRLLYPSLLRHIASHGFVIISFDTAYDTSSLTLANNTVIYGNASDYVVTTEGSDIDVTARAQDASFILDHLSPNITSLIPSCGDSCLNSTHVGIFGHSIGGAMSATAASRDDRIMGAANYDGALWGNVTEVGFHKPYLVFATQAQGMDSPIVKTALKSWVDVWPRITAPKWWLLLNDSLHYTFSDLPVTVERLGLATNESVRDNAQITDAPGARSEMVIATYTVAFFDFVFGGRVGSLLKGERATFPEVVFDSVDLHGSRGGPGNQTWGGGYGGMDGPDARFVDDDAVISGALKGRVPGCVLLLAASVVFGNFAGALSA